jgi:hypothetical protein
MPAIPFPASSAPGSKPQESGGRIVNGFIDKADGAARNKVIFRRSPGLTELFTISGHSHFRGGVYTSNTFIVVLDTRVYTVTESAGVYTAVNQGALAGTDPVTIAVNNAGTPNIVCVSTEGVFNLFTGSAPSNFADADLPQPNSVSMLDGYFIFTIGDGRIFATGVNNVSIATNSFTTEQGLTLRRGFVWKGEFYAMGDKWTGVYKDAATSPFPLERLFTIPRGIIGTHAIAGHEEGFGQSPIWVGEDGITYRLNGYTPEAIHHHDVEHDIENCADKSALEASVYMHSGHPFWVLTSPGEWTWELNLTTMEWTQRKSFGRDDWRASRSVFAFERWVVGDRTTGKFSLLSEHVYKEYTDPLVWELQSGCAANFPQRMKIPRADFDFTAAVGSASGEDPIQVDPVVLISWSLDGGHTFGNPVQRKLGKQGEGGKLVSILRLGTTKGKGIVFKLQVSDPVHVGFMGGQMAVEGLAP